MIPLRRLPKRALDIVLRSMTTMNQLFISLCNKSFKSQIHFLNTGIDFEFRIMIGEVCRIYVLSPDRGSLGLYFHTNESEDWSRKEGEPKRTFSENDTVLITYIATDWKYGKRFDAELKKSARQWILLLKEVFNLKKIETLKYESDDYCFNSIKETLRGLKLETLEITGNEAMRNHQEILKAVPSSDNFVQDSIQEVENYRNVLIQNFVSIDISFPFENFSDLLLINSKFVRIPGETFTIKNLNQFLKLWIKGSNPNAKHFSIHWIPLWDDDDDVKDVLKGIPYEVIPYAVEKSLSNVPHYVPDADKKIRGGYGIRRMVDGVEATVKLDCFATAFSFELFVWDE